MVRKGFTQWIFLDTKFELRSSHSLEPFVQMRRALVAENRQKKMHWEKRLGEQNKHLDLKAKKKKKPCTKSMSLCSLHANLAESKHTHTILKEQTQSVRV